MKYRTLNCQFVLGPGILSIALLMYRGHRQMGPVASIFNAQSPTFLNEYRPSDSPTPMLLDVVTSGWFEYPFNKIYRYLNDQWGYPISYRVFEYRIAKGLFRHPASGYLL